MHPEKAYLPILVSVVPRFIVVSPLQFLNAKASMLVVVERIEMDSMKSQFWNAPYGMVVSTVTVTFLIVVGI